MFNQVAIFLDGVFKTSEYTLRIENVCPAFHEVGERRDQNMRTDWEIYHVDQCHRPPDELAARGGKGLFATMRVVEQSFCKKSYLYDFFDHGLLDEFENRDRVLCLC